MSVARVTEITADSTNSFKSEIERAKYVFRVKEEPGEAIFILPEPLHESLKVAGNGFLQFDLTPGTTFTQAEEIAHFLNENIATIAYTKFL